MRWDPSFFVYALLVFLMVAAAAAAAVGAAVSSSVSSSVLPFVTWVKNIATKKYGGTLLVYQVTWFTRGHLEPQGEPRNLQVFWYSTSRIANEG